MAFAARQGTGGVINGKLVIPWRGHLAREIFGCIRTENPRARCPRHEWHFAEDAKFLLVA